MSPAVANSFLRWISASNQQIIIPYPAPDYARNDKKARWKLANELAMNAVHRLVGDYQRINQRQSGITYLQMHQRKYSKTPVAEAAAGAKIILKQGL